MQLDDGRRDFGRALVDGGRTDQPASNTNYREAAFGLAELAARQLIE